MRDKISNDRNKRDHTVVVPNFFSEGEGLEISHLGWDLASKVEAKTSVSKKIFNYFVKEGGMNLIFYYVADGNFYGIHTENCPTPVFRFRKDTSEPIVLDQLQGDTHDYDTGEILYMIPCGEDIWDTVRIGGKPLEEVLQNSYIVNVY